VAKKKKKICAPVVHQSSLSDDLFGEMDEEVEETACPAPLGKPMVTGSVRPVLEQSGSGRPCQQQQLQNTTPGGQPPALLHGDSEGPPIKAEEENLTLEDNDQEEEEEEDKDGDGLSCCDYGDGSD
jgi:hypothetical protein